MCFPSNPALIKPGFDLKFADLFLLSKILKVFFLPPGIFLLGLLWVWLLASGIIGKRRRAAWPALFLAVTFYLTSLVPVGGLLLHSLEHKYDTVLAESRGKKASAIIVLGGGLQPGHPGNGWQNLPSADSLQRALAGRDLQEMTGLPLLVSAGSVYGKSEPESEVMARFLADQGLSRGKLLVENKSRNTWENAQFSKALLGSNLGPIYLVTSAFHMPRSVSFFEKAGFSVIPYPVAYRTGRKIGLSPFWFFPSMDGLALSATALHEYLGLAAYHFRKNERS